MTYNFQQTTIGEICNVVTDGSHYSPKSVTRGEYMVSVKDFTPFGFDFSGCRQISKSDYDDLVRAGCVPEKDDILIGKDGARFFEDIVIYRQPQKPALLSSIAILRANKTMVEPEYLYYMLKSPLFKKDVRENYGSGSAIPRIILKDFRRMPVEIPPLPVQKHVAAILSSLDSRIANNSKINHHLEQIAQALFKSWFVYFEPFGGEMPSNWREGTISDLGNVIGGSTPSKAKPEYYTEHGIAWITPKDLSVNKNKFIARGADDITELGLRNSSAKLMPRGTVLFSSRAPIGYIAIASGEVCTNQGFKSIIPNGNVGTAFIYYFLIENLQTIESMASGSTFKEVSGTTMKGIPAIIPDDDTLRRFQEECTPIFEKQELLEKENSHLAEIRDALLPRLMSGELSVSYV